MFQCMAGRMRSGQTRSLVVLKASLAVSSASMSQLPGRRAPGLMMLVSRGNLVAGFAWGIWRQVALAGACLPDCQWQQINASRLHALRQAETQLGFRLRSRTSSTASLLIRRVVGACGGLAALAQGHVVKPQHSAISKQQQGEGLARRTPTSILHMMAEVHTPPPPAAGAHSCALSRTHTTCPPLWC